MSYQEQTTTDQTVAPTRDHKLATHSLLETMARDPSLRVFLDTLKAAGLEARLSGTDLFTLLAPANEVFGDSERPVSRMGDQVLPGAFTEAEIKTALSVKSLEGRSLKIESKDGRTSVGGARLVRVDIECTNGVIHVTDAFVSV